MAPGIRPRVLLTLGVAALSLLLATPLLLAQDGASNNRASITKPPAGLTPPGAGGHVETACGTISGSIACGDTINGTTVGAVNVMSSYACIPSWNETGPEDVYSLTLPPGGPWHLYADFEPYPLADVDLFILGPAVCNSNVCVAYGDSLTELVNAAGGATYYVVVDGYDGEAGEYELHVTCTAPDGWLEGDVQDIASQPPDPPCTAANVHVDPIGMDIGVDPGTGQYGPVTLATGAYDLTLTAVDYPLPLVATGVIVFSDSTTTVDFDMVRAAAAVSPTDFLGVEGVVGVAFSETLTIINDGYFEMDWEISEVPPNLPWVAVSPSSGTVPMEDQVDVDVYFLCPDTGDFMGDLLLEHSDPCTAAIDIPIILSCETGSDIIFEDGFENGDTDAWSLTVP